MALRSLRLRTDSIEITLARDAEQLSLPLDLLIEGAIRVEEDRGIMFGFRREG